MSNKIKAVDFTWDQPVLRLYCIGDTHIGAASSAEDKQAKLASIIKEDPLARIVGLGDNCESIAFSDRRFSAGELMQPIRAEDINDPFRRQAARFLKIWEQTICKWICLIPGNHETTVLNRYHYDITASIASGLNAKYIGQNRESGWLRIKLIDNNKTRSTVKVYMQHGWGGGEMKGGIASKMQRLLWKKDADIIMMAHTHQAMAFPETVETLNAAGVEESKTRIGVVCYPLVEKHEYIARCGGNAPAVGYTVVQIERKHDGQPLISVELHTL